MQVVLGSGSCAVSCSHIPGRGLHGLADKGTAILWNFNTAYQPRREESAPSNTTFLKSLKIIILLLIITIVSDTVLGQGGSYVIIAV